MYLDRRIFDSYVHEIWLPFIESKRKMVHFMSLATVKAESDTAKYLGPRFRQPFDGLVFYQFE